MPQKINTVTALGFLLGACLPLGALEIPYGAYPLDDGGEALFAHIVETRGEPLMDFPTEHVLHARDFGAVPETGRDALPGIRAALAKAVELGGATVQLEPGVYHLLSVADDDNAFAIDGGREIILEGNGAELLNHNPKSAFFDIRNSDRIILRNFTADYDPPPYTQGVIVGVNPAHRSFDLKVDEGYELADDSFFAGRNQIFGFLMDKRPEYRGRMKPAVSHAVRVVAPSAELAVPRVPGERRPAGAARGPEVVGPRTVRIQTTDNRIRFFEEGDLFVMLARSGSTAWVLYNNTRDLTFDNLTIHAAGAAVFIGSTCERVNIMNCRIIPRGDRLISANGGGAIAQSHGMGIWVENCLFQSISDDPINFYSVPLFPLAAGTDGGVFMHGAAPDRIAVGDTFHFFDTSEGKALFPVTVRSIERGGLVHFDPEVDLRRLDIVNDRSQRDRNILKQHDYALNLRLQSDYYVIRNNRFINCRGRLLLRASRGFVEGNEVVGSGMGGLEILNDWVVPEGYRVMDTVIRNNTFEEVGLVEDDKGANSITFVRLPREGDPFDAHSDHRAHRNILLQGNVFKNNFRMPFLSIHGIDHFMIRDNTFIQEPGHPYYRGAPETVLEIENSGFVTLEGNVNRTGAAQLVQLKEKTNNVVEVDPPNSESNE